MGSRVRGTGILDYLVVTGVMAIAIAASLVYVAGPQLVSHYRAAARSAASPVP